MKFHDQVVRLVAVRTRRGIHQERRPDAPAVEVAPIQNLLAVLPKHRSRIAIEVKRQPAVVLESTRDPEARLDLIANAAANGVALVLRIGKVAVRGQSLSVVP